LYVREKVVARIAERAALDVTGVVPVGNGGVTSTLTRSLPATSCRLGQAGARVDVAIAARWPVSLAALARLVRDLVATRVHELTGLPVASVDVTVARITLAEQDRRVE
jgi:uncharacterized alkaline shock family protein YloU